MATFLEFTSSENGQKVLINQDRIVNVVGTAGGGTMIQCDFRPFYVKESFETCSRVLVPSYLRGLMAQIESGDL